jgi:hypothetical protein
VALGYLHLPLRGKFAFFNLQFGFIQKEGAVVRAGLSGLDRRLIS